MDHGVDDAGDCEDSSDDGADVEEEVEEVLGHLLVLHRDRR